MRALPQLLKEKVADLRNERLDSDFFNRLLAPDPASLLLRWMNDSKKEKQARSKAEWKAFCEQCETDYKFSPDKDGELVAAKLLGQRKGEWAKVWMRFTEAPQRYLGVVSLLERIEPPKQLELGSDSESWPKMNDKLESEISDSLKTLGRLRPDQAAPRVKELEEKYGHQRNWVWREIGRSQFAVALEHLNELASLVEKPLAAPSLDELGDHYAKTGWKVDALVLKALDCCKSAAHEEPIHSAVRALYLGWLDQSARNLQTLKKSNPAGMRPRLGAVEARDGRIIVFADGLRYDVAQLLVESLQSGEFDVSMDWDWVPFPAVTATAKPFVSPVAALLKGGDAADEFTTAIAATGQRLTHDRFKSLLDGNGIQFLEGLATGDPTGKGWTEVGTLDKRGHDVGWKLAKIVDPEVKDLVARVRGLIAAGWKEVLVVTDHGWLLMPGGFPKIELPKFLVDSRWGRCAAMKDTSTTDLPLVGWHWNPAVSIASPPGIGCFKAGKEYDHGGISLQELVVPRIVVRRAAGAAEIAKIAGVKWVGLRCRVTIEGMVPGLKVDLRGRVAEAKSKVEGGKPKEVSEDGTVSLAVESPDDEGSAAHVVLLSNDEGTVLGSQLTTIGGGA
ncbi:MAG TPA: BREX-1 system phosphatase PglZ type B [Candidatus Binatia bacterium]|nr:BREX-1 system phosphatase PglZ type B [Candidatus Binatia bacterium]